jgi:hypothetical protein
MKKQFDAILCLIQMVVVFSAAHGQIDYDERNGMFVNFDDDNYGWAKWDCASPNTAQMSVVDNPEPDGINTSARVGQFLTSTCTYEGAYCTAEFKPIDFSEKTIFKIKVLAPSDGLTFLLKLEDYHNGQIFYEVSAFTTTYNEWEELSFDFSDAQSNAYHKIVVLPDFGAENQDYWYFDDIRLTDEEDTKVVRPEGVVKSYCLAQNYPNPFNPTTTIQFTIPQLCRVTLKLYDALGREVATLVDEEKQAGEYSVLLDATGWTSGVYFYKLQAGEFRQYRKFLLLK